jgi:hypothetical protein
VSQEPVLVLGWGKDGAEDVDAVVDEFGYDAGLRCRKAPELDSRAVLGEIASWLKGNKNARILYVGAHGTVTGLRPNGTSSAKIGYTELADTLLANLRYKKRKLTVWLGACESEAAATLLRRVRDLPVGLLVSFTGEPNSRNIRGALKSLIKMSAITHADKQGTTRPLTFIDCDVAKLKRDFPSISIHYKPSLEKVDERKRRGPKSMRSMVARRIRPDGLIGEAISDYRDGNNPENQATRELIQKKKSEHKKLLEKKRRPLEAKVVGIRKRKKTR